MSNVKFAVEFKFVKLTENCLSNIIPDSNKCWARSSPQLQVDSTRTRRGSVMGRNYFSLG